VGKYTLIITEKPDAAKRIASALNEEGKVKKIEDNGVPYYKAERDEEMIIVPALGHLYTIAEERKGRNYYPVFNFKWVPRYTAERGAKQIRTWIETISKLSKEADMFIDACDYDIEGSVIGYCILKYACDNKEKVAKRMKYSTLTEKELEKSYEDLLPELDFGLIEAGDTRHEVDWLYGVNLSRALTISARNWSGKYATLSTGRVQGPTLKFLVNREKSIRSFVPKPYWEIKSEVEIDRSLFKAEFEKKKIEVKREADEILRGCQGRNGRVNKIDVRRYQQKCPVPFNSGGLQSEAYSLLGYTPRRTSYIAQRLYLDALISYPRTSSQKLPSEINYKEILTKLAKVSKYKNLAGELLAKQELKPKEGKKRDPAHPAIYPTGEKPERNLEESETNVLDLIIRRFMAVFSEPAIKESMKVHINVNEHYFYLRGRRTVEEGWLHFYGPYARSEEIALPKIEEGQEIKVQKVILEDKFTSPPSRYNPGSILKKMEKTGIGTKATRANIIQTLYDRKYIQDRRIMVTDIGFEVLEVLERNCPNVVSVKMTSKLEKRMEEIQDRKEDRENVLTDTVDILKPVMEKLKEKEEIIGEQLSHAIKKARLKERIVGACPDCGKGELMILYSRKTGKRFIGCTSYFKGKCDTSFPLPQKGTVRPTRTDCGKCGWPTVRVRQKGKRPWTLCFNPDCPSKQERKKKK
jgi:DNA topoisomerase-1